MLSPPANNTLDPPRPRPHPAHATPSTAQRQVLTSIQHAPSATPTNETLMDPGNNALLEKSQSPQISDGKEDDATPPPQPAHAKITRTFNGLIRSEVLTGSSASKTAKLAWKKENPKKKVKDFDEYWGGLEPVKRKFSREYGGCPAMKMKGGKGRRGKARDWNG
ncbi:hypothetical protein BDN72DRAFT_964465 [Pluteus cervinus]|uniref:Uncharacterized protein n=1 Tax=Pluteus cervinus TaxID=181527 RepID=A0ACD3AAW0_9AGAR|nr:hypothetical protein BDN72DRAFT_964465 [Pluteus cervinus]